MATHQAPSVAPRIYTRVLRKPDGRELLLYGRQPIEAVQAPPGATRRGRGGAHLRWHPLRGEWIVYAGHDAHAPPSPAWDRFAATTDPEVLTEVPAGTWDVAVFECLHSALGTHPGSPPPPRALVPTAPCGGHCEVVVFAQDPATSLGALPLDHLALVLAVLAERTRVLGARPDVQYVLPFENRGAEVGATSAHPHGQIYAYPFVPPLPARALELQRAHHQARGRGLVADLIDGEIAADRRTLEVRERAVAWVPAFARWPYEIWVAPRHAVPSLDALSDGEREDLAVCLRASLRRLDALWRRPMPYVLSIQQAPAKGAHPYAHVHIEIYPWLCRPDRPTYLAATEVAAGAFTVDTLPETTAAELRGVVVP